MRKSKNCYFYHIFVSPGDALGAITLNVVWMEREFDAYKLYRSVYPYIFNSFPVIRIASAKNRRFHVPQPTFLFPWRRPCDYHAVYCIGGKTIQCLPNPSQHVPIYLPGAITLNVLWMETNYNRFWDRARYLWKNRHFVIPTCIRRPR